MMQFFCFLLILGLNTPIHTRTRTKKLGTKEHRKPTIKFVKKHRHNGKKYSRFARGTLHHYRGELTQAEEALAPIVHSKASPHVYEALIRLRFDQGNFFAIANLARHKKDLLETTFKDNLEMKLLFAQSLLHAGNEKEATDLFEHLKTTYPDNDQVGYYNAVALIQKNKLPEALDYLNTVLANNALKSRHFLFLFLQSKVFMMQNNPTQALVAIEKSLVLFPKFDRGLLMKSMLLEQMGQIPQAIESYENFLSIAGREPNIEKQLIQLLFSQQQFAKAGMYLKKIQSNTPEYFFDLALIGLKLNDLQDALYNIDQCLAKKADFEKAKLLKLEILLMLDRSPQILEFVQAWLIEDPNNTNLLQTLTMLRAKRLKTADVIALLQNIVTQKRESFSILAYLADLYQETKQNAESIETLEKAEKIAPSDLVKSQTLFQIGYLHFTSKNFEKMVYALEKSIACEQSHPAAYNLLAYHYVQKNKHLDKALALINIALQKNPSCYYFLDTKGCILLKLGKKQEAQKLLRRALQQAPDDKIIQDHLAQASN